MKICESPLPDSILHTICRARLPLYLLRFFLCPSQLFLGLQIIFHFTKWYIFCLNFPYNRKALVVFSTSSILFVFEHNIFYTWFGNMNIGYRATLDTHTWCDSDHFTSNRQRSTHQQLLSYKPEFFNIGSSGTHRNP
jgi:hypothetical protein